MPFNPEKRRSKTEEEKEEQEKDERVKGTKIESLPEGLKVGGKLELEGKEVKASEEPKEIKGLEKQEKLKKRMSSEIFEVLEDMEPIMNSFIKEKTTRAEEQEKYYKPEGKKRYRSSKLISEASKKIEAIEKNNWRENEELKEELYFITPNISLQKEKNKELEVELRTLMDDMDDEVKKTITRERSEEGNKQIELLEKLKKSGELKIAELLLSRVAWKSVLKEALEKKKKRT